MRLTTYLIALCFSLGGCVSLEDSSTYVNAAAASNGKVLNAMVNVKTGMSRQEITAVLKNELLIGYRIEGSPEKLNPITLAQPYREETLTKNGRAYQVLFYFTSVNRPDDLVADDELTPLVFENDLLVGKGLADLDRIKRM